MNLHPQKGRKSTKRQHAVPRWACGPYCMVTEQLGFQTAPPCLGVTQRGLVGSCASMACRGKAVTSTDFLCFLLRLKARFGGMFAGRKEKYAQKQRSVRARLEGRGSPGASTNITDFASNGLALCGALRMNWALPDPWSTHTPTPGLGIFPGLMLYT